MTVKEFLENFASPSVEDLNMVIQVEDAQDRVLIIDEVDYNYDEQRVVIKVYEV